MRPARFEGPSVDQPGSVLVSSRVVNDVQDSEAVGKLISAGRGLVAGRLFALTRCALSKSRVRWMD